MSRILAHLPRIVGTALSLALFAERAPAQSADSAGVRLLLRDVVRQALDGAPQLLLAQQSVVAAAGALSVARAPFDATVRSAALRARDESYPLTSATAFAEQSVAMINTQYSLSLAKQLRSGIVMTPSLSVARAGPSTVGTPPGRGNAMLTVDVPLLRGRGGGLAAASERSAERVLDATEFDMRHAAAESVLDAVLSYWNYASASARLDVLRDSESRATRLVEETRTLVSAEERAPAEMDQMLTNLALKRSSRIGAEQALVESRAALARTIGIGRRSSSAVLVPGTPFPEPSARASTRAPSGAALVADALARREDRTAARLRTDAAALRRDGAHRDAQPGIFLRVGAGYSGISMGASLGGYLGPIYQNVPGLNSTVQITYDLPLRNSGAHGAVMQLEAAARQYEMLMRTTERDIESGVLVADEAYRHAIVELEAAQEAVTLARRAVENEKTKFSLGFSTQVDVILAHDALTNALLGEISGHVHFASALVRLRYETGTLVTRQGDAATVDVDALLTDATVTR